LNQVTGLKAPSDRHYKSASPWHLTVGSAGGRGPSEPANLIYINQPHVHHGTGQFGTPLRVGIVAHPRNRVSVGFSASDFGSAISSRPNPASSHRLRKLRGTP